MTIKSLLGGNHNKHSKIRRSHIPFIAPAMIICVALIAIPFVTVVVLSFTNYELGMLPENFRFIGWRNYDRIFFSETTLLYHSLRITIGMMVVATIIQIVLGFICASLLNKDIKLKGLAIACLLIPVAMTPSIASQIWRLMLNAEFGVINFLLDRFLGVSVVWLGPENALLSVLIATVWIMTPFVTLILYAGLRSLPEEPFEAAKIDGASAVQVLFRITLPLLKPLILLTILFRSIDILRMFDLPYVLTQGGPGHRTEFIGLHIFRMGFSVNRQVGRASAVSVVLIIIVAAIAFVLIRMMRTKED